MNLRKMVEKMQKSFDDLYIDNTKIGTKIPKERYCENGENPIIDQGHSFISGYTDMEEGLYYDVPAIIFGDHTRAIKYIDVPFFLGADGVKLLNGRYSDANVKYLYYALCASNIPNTGYNRHFKWLKELKFNYPSKQIQYRITAILDKIANLIDEKNNQLSKLDLLVKSLFIEMFGEPSTNAKGWDTETLRAVSKRISDGPFGSNLKTEHYAESGVRVIRLSNIGVSEFVDNDKVYVSESHYETIKKYTCRSGELVIGTLGEPNLRACIVPDFVGYAINKADCVHFVPDDKKVNTCFVCQYINLPETLALASDSIHGQTRSRISMSQVAALPIFTPPLALQNRFADLVKAADKSKVEIQKGLEKLELQYKALMQQYFG